MIFYRWLSIRLFFSLVALPVFAAPILLLLHQYWFPKVYFQDLPVVLLIWLVLFAGVHIVVSGVGVRRFQYLNAVGGEYLKASNEYLIAEIFQYLQHLMQGGLLPLSRRRHYQDILLKRYFDFYARHIDEHKYRTKVRLCLQKGIHAARAFQVLKTYLLQQEALTLEHIDLAEELLEYAPEDADIVMFMADRYLADRQNHSRAELFYLPLLQWNDKQYVDRIIGLCLEKVLHHRRYDDFAAWLLVRAYHHGEGQRFQRMGMQLFHLNRMYQKLRRHDDLAAAVAEIVAALPREVVEAAKAEEQKREARTLRFWLARAQYRLHQWLITGWDYVKLYRHYLFYALTMAAFGTMVYLFLPAGLQSPEAHGDAQRQQVAAPGQKWFTVQVAATKNARSAQREVARLKKAGYDAYLVEPRKRGGFYKIRVGRFTTKSEAEQAARIMLKRKLIREYFLVNYQPETAPRQKP